MDVPVEVTPSTRQRVGFGKRLGGLALAPFHTLQILTGRKDFRNAVLGSERLNRKGLHVWRVKAAARVTEWRRKRLAHLVTPAERDFFAENGYIERLNLLGERQFHALVEEVEALRAPAREMREGGAVTRRIPLTPDVLRSAPTLAAFLRDERWTGPIRYVGGFDVEPVLSIQTIFGEPSVAKGARDPQTDLHMDTFHSTAKAWYFLYDVPEDEGPFTYVAGSHKLTPRRLAWHKRQSVLAAKQRRGGSFRIPLSALKRLRLPQPTRFAVPANTLVVGDTFGFHARGHSARHSIRVELYASQRPNPFLPFTRFDSAKLPYVSGRKEVISWYFEDWLVKLKLQRLIWRPVGVVSARESPPGR
ncbi:phytanoyl-CoA dioxygenase family protein [Rhizobium sp. NFR03]|uniref:phytanoyl-CoA dioxygenase family protein n=1 Tax=Rhizobium sp. NFR03 TaxID=1566263 RepID=UPI0008CF81E3|nr:phytanoyl-CoA dioxygenase family protein [Rhizobium sp. NFR03]SES07996.1 Phytanoyl-CoA dioxygenase (PhyH) [Rhizobium sp. NFR03]